MPRRKKVSSGQRTKPTKSGSAAQPPGLAARLSARRRVAFRIVAASIPVLLLVGAEGALRLGGYGGRAPLIQRIGREGDLDWFATNRAGAAAYFSRSVGGSGGMRNFAFAMPKPAAVVRIGLFGDSAMQAYPQPLPLTNGSFLKAMLEEAWGDGRQVEVLNFGCTAVASYVSLQASREALAFDLDLAIVMAGD